MSLRENVAPPAVLAAGFARPRNFAHNVYPFRAESHFLYLVGHHIEGALLVLDESGACLYFDPPDPDAQLWHGASPSLRDWQESLGLVTRPLCDLSLGDTAACLPPQDDETAAWLSALLDRPVEAQSGPLLSGEDARLAEAMVQCRLCHDEFGVLQLEQAASGSARAHKAAMRATRDADTETKIRGVIEGALISEGLFPGYSSIVTTRGEVLHAERSDGALSEGSLLLCDVGGETREGFTADITRTWPVSGKFSPTQRDVYDLVLHVQKAAIERVKPGADYRDLHFFAVRSIAEGLFHLGILRGGIDELVEKGAASVFFPHGLGHLLGVDVHDMEDLGDRAGHGSDARRSSSPTESALRLSRRLSPGMCVTIEPGFYRVPRLLERARADDTVGPLIDWDRLASFGDVRGIRVEDDVLVTAAGARVLTEAAPKEVAELEQILAG